MWQELFQMYSMPAAARVRQWGSGQAPRKIAKEA
jgi:hypothetical protein